MFAPDRYVADLRFAAARHATQKVPGSELPYVVHLTSVAAEAIAAGLGDFAVTCARLHDVIEDTASGTVARAALGEVISGQFGAQVAAGVWALTKDEGSPRRSRWPTACAGSGNTPTTCGP